MSNSLQAPAGAQVPGRSNAVIKDECIVATTVADTAAGSLDAPACHHVTTPASTAKTGYAEHNWRTAEADTSNTGRVLINEATLTDHSMLTWILHET